LRQHEKMGGKPVVFTHISTLSTQKRRVAADNEPAV
jgi:hypothetical protein